MKKYRPSNGTEGEGFMEIYCSRCRKDAKFRETQDGTDGCPIIAATMLYDVDDDRYPSEWVQDESGAGRCTAFVEGDEPWQGTAKEQNSGSCLPGMEATND